jgi:PAS domain S-box-containing protein
MSDPLSFYFVDDSDLVRKMATEVLKGHHVECFSSGQACWESILMNGVKCDIIITDVYMPQMGGVELIRRIRSRPEIKQVPIILLSDEKDYDKIMEGLDAGAATFISKPINREKILEAAHKVVLKDKLGEKHDVAVHTVLDTILDENEFLNNVFNTVSDAIWIIDNNGDIVRSNKAAQEILGIEPSQFVGNSIDKYVRLKVEEEQAQPISSVKNLDQWGGLVRMDDGTEVSVLIAKKELKDISGEVVGYIISAKDIREQQKLQEEIFGLEKWRSLGEMAAGVAHEINNPLAIIRGYAEDFQVEISRGELDEKSLDKGLNKIVEMTERVSKIIRSLRVLARDGSSDDPEIVDIHSVIDDCIHTYQERIAKAGVELKMVNPEFTQEVMVQRTQITQVLLNLVVNALDAVKDQKDAWISVETVDCGKNIEIRVSDSGPGVPKVLQDKIFDPFFSTKGNAAATMKSGLGMGLSLSRSLAEHNRGQLLLDRKAKNTCFILMLPKLTELKIQDSA